MLQKNVNFCNILFSKQDSVELFAGFHGYFAEFLEVLHESESGLTCACASGFVTLVELEDGVLTECLRFCVDLF